MTDSSILPFDLGLDDGEGVPPSYRVGTIQESFSSSVTLELSPELEPYLESPWYRNYVESQVPGSLAAGIHAHTVVPEEVATLNEDNLRRHAFLVGKSDYGKSRLLTYLLFQQMKAGRSVLAIDSKWQSVLKILYCAKEAGVRPENVVLLDPTPAGGGVPGWNILNTGGTTTQAVETFLDLFNRIVEIRGTRMETDLRQFLTILVTHRLSFYELLPLMLNGDYAKNLLKRPVGDDDDDPIPYDTAREFMERVFLRMSPEQRSVRTEPIASKVSQLVDSAFLLGLFCPIRQTLDLESLWNDGETEGPKVVIALLDQDALGDARALMLGGFLTYLLRQAARRPTGTRPVVLAIDEIGVQAKFVADTLASIQAQSREQHLRLLVATQRFSQLPPDLQDAFIEGTETRGYFNLDPKDANLIADTLRLRSSPSGETAYRRRHKCAPEIKRHGIPDYMMSLDFVIQETIWPNDTTVINVTLDQYVRAAKEVGLYAGDDNRVHSYDLNGLRSLFRALGRDGMPGLIVKWSDSYRWKKTTVEEFVEGLGQIKYQFLVTLPDMEHHRSCVRIYRNWGEPHVRLSIRIDAPRLKVTTSSEEIPPPDKKETWSRLLINLEPRECVLDVTGQQPRKVEVDYFHLPEVDPPEKIPDELKDYLAKVRASNHLTRKEILELRAWRRDQINRIAAGEPPISDGGTEVLKEKEATADPFYPE